MPNSEFEEIRELMARRNTKDTKKVREERYVIYRNFLLQNAVDFEKKYRKMTNGTSVIDYLTWIDMDLKGFDTQKIGSEFVMAWKAGAYIFLLCLCFMYGLMC